MEHLIDWGILMILRVAGYHHFERFRVVEARESRFSMILCVAGYHRFRLFEATEAQTPVFDDTVCRVVSSL